MPGVTTALAVLALLVSLLALGVVLRPRRSPEPPPPPPPPPAQDLTAREALERLRAEADETREAIATLADRVGALGEPEQEGLEGDLRRLATGSGGRAEGWGREAADLREAFAADAVVPRDARPGPRRGAPGAAARGGARAEDRVRAHLRREGWEDVVLLPVPGDAPDDLPTWRVEARRQGGLAKGRARLFPDGRVESRLTPPTRAFP